MARCGYFFSLVSPLSVRMVICSIEAAPSSWPIKLKGQMRKAWYAPQTTEEAQSSCRMHEKKWEIHLCFCQSLGFLSCLLYNIEHSKSTNGKICNYECCTPRKTVNICVKLCLGSVEGIKKIKRNKNSATTDWKNDEPYYAFGKIVKPRSVRIWKKDNNIIICTNKL